MISCLNAARYFIVRAYEDGIEAEMTNMKLQKLLYYSQSLHFALYDEPLFSEEIQAWRYGPVCPKAYQFYSNFEAEQLPIPRKETCLKAVSDKKELLEEVWDYFGGYHAYRLSDMTHEEFPWKKARKGLPPDASSREPILHGDMKALGLQKLHLIERDHPTYGLVVSEVLSEVVSETGHAGHDSLIASSFDRIQKGEVRDWLDTLLD